MGPRDHLSLCACNTAWLATELLVSIGTSLYLWFLLAKQRHLDQNKQVSMGPRHPLPFCACNTAWLAPELLVPALISCFCKQNSAFSTGITSLYGSQTSSVFLSTYNSVLRTRKKILYCLQPSPVVLCMQNGDFRTRITSLCGSKTPPVVCACKKAPSRPE